jgi:hypothetical protein
MKLRRLFAAALLLCTLTGAASAQSWPPAKVSFVANPNPDSLGTTGGVFNSTYDVRWYSTIKASDGYTGGANPPTTLLDAVNTVSWNFSSAIVSPASNIVTELDYLLQKNVAVTFPPGPSPGTFPWTGSASLALDSAVPYTRSGVDTSGLTRYLRNMVDVYSMVGRADAGAGTTTEPPAAGDYVDFVFKVTGPAGSNVTAHVARGYYNYSTAALSSGSIEVITRNPIASWDHTYNTSTTEDPQSLTVTRAATDTTVSFTIPAGGVYYFVVPAYVGSHVIMSSNCVGAGSLGMRTLTGQVDTRYEIDVYKMTSP